MPQNFGSIISRTILDKLSFDFYENGENRFVERVEFYNKLMEKVISQDKINNAFIAGGFFLKYKRDKFRREEVYQKFCSAQDINIYIYIGKYYFAPVRQELLTSINEVYRNRAEYQNVCFNSVYETYKIERVELNDETVVTNVIVHVCSVPCNQMLRKFTFEPCKIAYQYNAKCLTVDYWFVKGFKLYNRERTENAKKLIKRFRKKGLCPTISFRRTEMEGTYVDFDLNMLLRPVIQNG